MKFFWLFCISFCCGLIAQAQVFQFQPSSFLPIQENGVLLKQGWGGGMLLPVFQQIDLNNDGFEDLVVLDRIDNTISTYLAQREGSQWIYRATPGYASLFPRVFEFLDLVDYDGDGKKDLFTSANGSVMVYQNIGTIGSPQFVMRSPWLQALYIQQSFSANIYVSSAEKPVIADVDGDGDIDILAYELGALGQIRLYKNTSMERFNHRDSLTFETENICWGRFQSYSDSLILMNNNCNVITGGNRQMPEHVNWNLTAVDANKDGLIDLVMGDFGSPYLRYLTNNGQPDSALIQAIHPQFPQYDSSLYIDSYPAAYFLDLNHDNRQDMVVAATQYFNFKSRDQVWMYENVSNSLQDSFQFKSSSFLADEMLQHQTRSAPFLIDVNGDGAQDLILSFTGTNNYSRVYLYLRKVAPTTGSYYFDLVDTAFLGINSLSLTNVQFAGGDLNGNAKQDLIVGSFDGKLRFFENISTANGYAFSAGVELAVTPDTAVAPELIDINRDGKLDLLVGNYRGRIVYYQNVGTTFQANFQLVSNAFGNINLSAADPGWAKPRISDFNSNGNFDLVVGGIDGHLHFYPDIENQLLGTFSAQNNAFYYHETGIYADSRLTNHSNPCIGFINQDNLPDLIVGNERGGLTAFANNLQQLSVEPLSSLSQQIVLYPNPTQTGKFTIDWRQEPSAQITELEILDLHGRKVPFIWEKSPSTVSSLTLTHPGLYLVSIITSNNQRLTKRILFTP